MVDRWQLLKLVDDALLKYRDRENKHLPPTEGASVILALEQAGICFMWQTGGETEEQIPANACSVSSAPRDGTMIEVAVRTRENPGFEWVRARVVMTWVTDEFIPEDISDTDTAGMNHGAIINAHILGWRPC